MPAVSGDEEAPQFLAFADIALAVVCLDVMAADDMPIAAWSVPPAEARAIAARIIRAAEQAEAAQKGLAP